MTQEHKSIIIVALTSFVARCDTEEETMRNWAADEDMHFTEEQRIKCFANAEASAQLRQDALAALGAI